MSLKLNQDSMPISDEITKELDLSDKNVILVQHGVRDAIDFGLKLKNNSNGDVLFLPKPFSQKREALDYGINNGLNILNPGISYEDGLEKKGFLEKILEERKNKKNIIIEVGGVFANIFQNNPSLVNNVEGLVEVTTFGHNRHIKSQTNKKIPTYSIARSPIKEKEAQFVGYAIYRSLDKVLHSFNRAITNYNVTMIGYGMIGENVCNAFKNCKSINVIDKDKKKLELAKKKGFDTTNNYLDFINDSDIVIASTGGRAINDEVIKSCKNEVLLVSGGSRQNEIDVEFLEKNTQKPVENIGEYIKKYIIDSKIVYLFREGKNANFVGNSCPSQSMDLIHSEVLFCVRNILDGKYDIKKSINETTKKERLILEGKYKHYWG